VAIVRGLIYFFICLLLSCQQGGTETVPPLQPDTLTNSFVDSIGELVHGNFAAFEKEPDEFIRPLETARLNPEQQEAFIWVLINMGYAFQEHSRFLASIKYYEKALLYDYAHSILTNEDRLIFLYKPLANNYTIIADYEKAESLQLKAINEASDADIKASFYNNLTLLYIYKEEVSLAKEAGLAGLQLRPNDHYLSALLHNSLSSTYALTDQLDSANIHNKLALALTSKQILNKPIAAAKIAALERKSQFLLLDKSSSLTQARQVLIEALSLENRWFPDTRLKEKANLYNLLGENCLSQKSYLSAKNYFDRSNALLRKQAQEASQQTSSYTLIHTLKNLGIVHAQLQSDSALHYFGLAIESDFSYQQNITSKASHITGNKWGQQLLSLVFNHVGNPEDFSQEKMIKLLWLTELTKGRMLWNDINRTSFWDNDTTVLNDGMKQLQQLYMIRDNLTDSSDLAEINESIQTMLTDFQLEEQYFTRKVPFPSFDNFQKQLTDSLSVTYSYFVHPDSSLSIFKVDDGKISYIHQKTKGLLNAIAHFKKDYFSTSPHLFNNDPKHYFRRAQYLKDQILPFLPAQSITLRISLHDELYILPFDALTESDRFLVEDFDIQYVNSLLIKDLYPHISFQNPQINILYRDKYSPPLANLYFVKKEVENLQSHYNATTFAYQDLPAQKLENAFKKLSIIHIAAHTVVTPQQEARLLLHQSISADQLRYYHIKSPLVVLSACNTASGNLLPSEGLESINRAFLSKGIPGVMATHWFASDDATLNIIAKFYDELVTCKSPIRALAEAKRTYLSEQLTSGKNPWYWSNIAYTGTDIKIDLQKHASLRQSAWKISISFLMLASCLYGILRFTKFKNKQNKTYHKHQK